MANRHLEIETGFPTPLSSATDPPPPSRWWTQLHSLFLRRNELTKEEKSAISKPRLCGFLTILILTGLNLVLQMYNLLCHASVSVESITVSPSSSATLHIDFLLKPSLSCPIQYNGDDVYAKLGSLNAAVLKLSRGSGSRGGHTSFSVDLATEGNHRVFELDLKLSTMKEQLALVYEYGHFDIRCQNLTIGYQKTKCHSSYKALDDPIRKLLN
ncbi:hypothetical protein ISN44_As05g020500 [Arabidopsis suecica]|uniref:Uncharacterized protein n=1 Tax=Arabidopsis suecica TaxID=45249 RepID=A0A8T2DKY7_ARASU|nr:hypothetical protein ISN44_As05g020500 [Arabidopsis suecica]